MDTTTESSTFMQSEANASRGYADTSAANVSACHNSDPKHDESADNNRETLHASEEEETTNPYEPEDGEEFNHSCGDGEDRTVITDTHSSSMSSSSASSVSSRSVTPHKDEAAVQPSREVAAATATSNDHDGSNPTEKPLRLTCTYQESPSDLVAPAPPTNAPAQQQLQHSPNISNAFSGNVSQIVAATATNTSTAVVSPHVSFTGSIDSPQRSNFVGGPGGPGRSAAGPTRGSTTTAASSPYQQGSPVPSAPQTANNSSIFPFSDSYAISQGAGVNAPSFNAGYATSATNPSRNRFDNNDINSNVQALFPRPQPTNAARGPEAEFFGHPAPTRPGTVKAVSAGGVVIVDPPTSAAEHQLVTIPVSDEDAEIDVQPPQQQHSKRKRHWSSPEDAELPHRTRRLHPINDADEDQGAEDNTDTENEGDASHTDEDFEHDQGDDLSDEGSYSTSSHSYSYSYSYSYSDEENEEEEDEDEEGLDDEEGEEREDYEYYEEFYEEEVEEDEEDEEEPRIDIIDGHGHGNTLHDILYGTPKAGANTRNDYNKDFTESMRPERQYNRNAAKTKDARRSHPRHHRHHEEEEVEAADQRKQDLSAPTNSSSVTSHSAEPEEDKNVMAIVPVRDATPERVSRHHHHAYSKRSSRSSGEPTESDEEEEEQQQQQQRAVAATKSKDTKKPFKRGEPYTEGTFKPAKDEMKDKKQKISKKAMKPHYGRVNDLDGATASSESDYVVANSEEGGEVRHEPVTAAVADVTTSSLSSAESSDFDDEFTAPSGSVSRRRRRKAEAKTKKTRTAVTVAPATPLSDSDSSTFTDAADNEEMTSNISVTDAAADVTPAAKPKSKEKKSAAKAKAVSPSESATSGSSNSDEEAAADAKGKKSSTAGSQDAVEVVVAEEPIKTPVPLKTTDAEAEVKHGNEQAPPAREEKKESKGDADAVPKDEKISDGKSKKEEKKDGFMSGFMNKFSRKKDEKKERDTKKEKDGDKKKSNIFASLCSCGGKKGTKDAVSGKNRQNADEVKMEDKRKEEATKKGGEEAKLTAEEAKKYGEAAAKCGATSPAKTPAEHGDSKSAKEEAVKKEGKAEMDSAAAAGAPAKPFTDVSPAKRKTNKLQKEYAAAVSAPTAPLSESSFSTAVTDEEESNSSAAPVPEPKERRRRSTQRTSTCAMAAAAATPETPKAVEKKGKKAKLHIHGRRSENKDKQEENGDVRKAKETIIVEDPLVTAAQSPRRQRRSRDVEKASKSATTVHKDSVATKTEKSMKTSKNVISIDATPMNETSPRGKTKSTTMGSTKKKSVGNAWDDVD